MTDLDQLFYQLIRVALGNQVCLSHTPSADEWGELYAVAKKQSLVGICFAGVQTLIINHPSAIINLRESLRLQWMGMAAKIQQRNEIVNQQCVEVQKKIEADGFRTFIMKGQGNVDLYGSLSTLRQSGDIDIYLEGGFEMVNAYVQKTCPTNEINELEIHYHILKDTDIEIHYRPFIMRNPFRNAKLQRFFKDQMYKKFYSSRIIDTKRNLAVNVPSVEFNLVHQMVHIYHHLFTEGIGLRQLMDYYFLLRNTNCHELTTNYSLIFSQLGLDCFASALMWVLGHVFGGDNTNLGIEQNEKDGKFLLNEIMLAGNFGKQDERMEGLYDSKWNAFWIVNMKTIRFWRFDHWAWFWSPLWRVYHFIWKRVNGFKK